MGIRISQLPETSIVGSDDYFVIADQSAGKTYKTKASSINTWFVSQSLVISGALNSSIGTINPRFQLAMPNSASILSPDPAGGVVLVNNAGNLTITDANSVVSNISAKIGNFTGLIIDGDILPLTDVTYKVGSTDFQWLQSYIVSGTFDHIHASASVYVSGNVNVGGVITATAKSFLINHPTKPGMKLQYASLEGPEHAVFIRGHLLDRSIIFLPEYWKNLVDINTISVHLTPVGEHQCLYVESISDAKIAVKNGALLSNFIDCFYTVYAERKDIPKLETEL